MLFLAHQLNFLDEMNSFQNPSQSFRAMNFSLNENLGHCKKNNMNNFIEDLSNDRYKHLFPNKDHVFLMTNFIEDRRIDNFVYNSAPGYKAYYESMYESSFFNENINKGLKSNEYRTETWESYLFRIINIFNPNSDLDALHNLRKIYNINDLDNIDRLKS